MVKRRGFLITPEDSSEYVPLMTFYIVLMSAGLAAYIAGALLWSPFIAQFLPIPVFDPRFAATYAEIAAGLSMPLLAMLTFWYASETKRLVSKQSELIEYEREEREAELAGLLRDFWTEIRSHPVDISEFEEILLRGEAPNTDVYDTNSNNIAKLPTSHRTKINEYYMSLDFIASIIRSNQNEDQFQELDRVFRERRRAAMQVVSPDWIPKND